MDMSTCILYGGVVQYLHARERRGIMGEVDPWYGAYR